MLTAVAVSCPEHAPVPSPEVDVPSPHTVPCAHCGRSVVVAAPRVGRWQRLPGWRHRPWSHGEAVFCCADKCRQAERYARLRAQGVCRRCGTPSASQTCPTCAQTARTRIRGGPGVEARFQDALRQARRTLHVDGWERR